MKYDRFEDLPVWKSAIESAVGIYALTKQRAFRGPGDLRSQLRRAALSVSNNIAEGFERGTTAELLMFLYIARGSAGEVRSMLHFVERLLEARSIGMRPAHQSAEGARSADRPSDGGRTANRPSGAWPSSDQPSAGWPSSDQPSGARPSLSNLKSEISNLKSLAESCSRQIRAWSDSLQNTDIKGQRYLTKNSREAYQFQRRADRFWEQIETATKARWSKTHEADHA
jgi:four helix bundle protein